MKFPAAIATLLLVVSLAVAVANAAPAIAQDELPTPGKLQATEGENQGEVILTWESVEQAGFYRIAWLSETDYRADVEAGRDWEDSITYKSVANDGQTSETIIGLKSGDTYVFRVGSSAGRDSEPSWSKWSDPVTLIGCAGDRDALVALYNSTNGNRWQKNQNGSPMSPSAPGSACPLTGTVVWWFFTWTVTP